MNTPATGYRGLVFVGRSSTGNNHRFTFRDIDFIQNSQSLIVLKSGVTIIEDSVYSESHTIRLLQFIAEFRRSSQMTWADVEKGARMNLSVTISVPLSLISELRKLAGL